MDHDKAAVRKVTEVKALLQQSQRNHAELLTLTTNLLQAKEQELAQDLEIPSHLAIIPPSAWTISTMRRQFGNFPKARQHFRQLYGVRANNWATLNERVNVIETAFVHLGLLSRSST